ncbi:MAG: hypothetical protein EOO33_03800 [Comamonadaceae bacterium]|nr:MAG: hypothetical protein EOO33_03800 [Comamonadaceae bacterium]
MTQPPLLNAQAWMAAGVQHAVLIRALPAVRHDLASPMSVMRMGMTVLKRRLANGADPQPEQSVDRVTQLEEQLLILGDHVRRLRNWDLNIHERQPARATLHQAIELAKPLLALRGVLLESLADEASPAASDEDPPVAHHTLLYVLLGAIYHLAEESNEPPAQVAVELSSTSIRLRAQGKPSPDALPPLVTAGAQGTQPIDTAALLCLAQHLSVAVQCAPREVVITLA